MVLMYMVRKALNFCVGDSRCGLPSEMQRGWIEVEGTKIIYTNLCQIEVYFCDNARVEKGIHIPSNKNGLFLITRLL